MIADNNNQSLESGEQGQEQKLQELDLVRFQLRQGQGADYALDNELYTGQNNTYIQGNKDDIEKSNEQSKEQKQKYLDLQKFEHRLGHGGDYALQNDLFISQNSTEIQDKNDGTEKSNEESKEQKQKDLNLVKFELRQEHEDEFVLADKEFGQEYGDNYASEELELVQDEFGQEDGEDYANDDLFVGNIQAIIGITIGDGTQKEKNIT